MRARKGGEIVAFQEIKHTLAIEIGNNADMISKVEALSKMNASVPVVAIVVFECLENTISKLLGQSVFDCIPIFLNRPNDLDRHRLI